MINWEFIRFVARKQFFAVCLFTIAVSETEAYAATLPTTDGFYGAWYENEPDINGGLYGPKYAGGLGTYPQQTNPVAVYSVEANRTYFTFGGNSSDTSAALRNYISYYDHSTGLLARPRQVRFVGGETCTKTLR